MTTFFPASTLQAIIEYTGGCPVEYRGQQAFFHVEDPTFDDIFATSNVQGVAKILIGDATVFTNLAENTLITVDGDDYLVGEWKTPGDGGVIYIALKTSTRT